MRNRTDGFISGATFRDGCTADPVCETPYAQYREQCLFFAEQYHPWSPSLADARRTLNDSRNICNDYGGFLPHGFSGFTGGSRLGDRWHWVGYGADDNQCWACRPGRWGEGVRAFPCSDSLSFACQRNTAFPLALPSTRPRVYGSPGLAGGGGGRPQVFVVSNGGRLAGFRPGRRTRLRDRWREAELARRYLGSASNNPFLFV